MTAYLIDWLNLLLRWAHIVIGIGWIGTSFYFIALDLSLRKREKMNPGVAGTAWEVHGGGFYHVEKYLVAPKELPGDLIWYRWEAYLTWVTGFALLVIQYYIGARSFLIDPSVMALTPLQATAIGVLSLAAGWIVYDLVCKSPLGRNTTVLALIVFAMILIASYGYTQVFSGRGAFIHIGSFIGTIMAANVFMVIIPNQKKITAQLLAGEAPDPKLGQIGKQRSTHNNYLTLPVILMMVSNHYPFLTSHPHSWVVAGFIVVAGGAVRHFINRHDAGDPFSKIAWALPAGAAALFAAAVITAPRPVALPAVAVSDETVLAISEAHCVSCHAANPRHESFDEAPGEVALETVEDLRRHAQRIMAQAVQTDAMPLGNETEMSDDERQTLGAWLAAQ